MINAGGSVLQTGSPDGRKGRKRAEHKHRLFSASFEVLFIYYICVYVHTCMHMLEGACLSQVMHGGQRTTLLSLFPPFIFLGITE